MTRLTALEPDEDAAAVSSRSSTVSRATRWRSHPVAAPGPGPISSISVPRSTRAVTTGSTSAWMYAAHSGLPQSLSWLGFIPPTLRSALPPA